MLIWLLCGTAVFVIAILGNLIVRLGPARELH